MFSSLCRWALDVFQIVIVSTHAWPALSPVQFSLVSTMVLFLVHKFVFRWSGFLFTLDPAQDQPGRKKADHHSAHLPWALQGRVLIFFCPLLSLGPVSCWNPGASSPFSNLLSLLGLCPLCQDLGCCIPPPPQLPCASQGVLPWDGGEVECLAWMKSNQGTLSQAPGSGSSHPLPHSLS